MHGRQRKKAWVRLHPRGAGCKGWHLPARAAPPNRPQAPGGQPLRDARAAAVGEDHLLAVVGDEAVRAFLNEHNPDALQEMAQTFANAARRGMWLSRRNSAMTMLRDMLGDPAPMGLAS